MTTAIVVRVPRRNPVTDRPRPWDTSPRNHVAGYGDGPGSYGSLLPDCFSFTGYGDGVSQLQCDRRLCPVADKCYESMRDRVTTELADEVAEFQEELEQLLADMRDKGGSDANLAVKMLRKRWEDEGRTLPFEIAYRAHERAARVDRGWLPCRGAGCDRAVQREDLLDALGRCPRCEREDRQTVAAAEAGAL